LRALLTRQLVQPSRTTQGPSRPAAGTAAALGPADIGRAAAPSAPAATRARAEAPADPKAIWADEEVADADDLADADDEADDGRAKAEYDILYKQAVTSEDMYLGMGGKDPSSTSCEAMVVRVKLPGESVSEIDLDVKPQAIVVRSPRFRLVTYLPHPVRHQEGKARWLKDKGVLEVTLPIVRKELWELEG